MQFSKILAITFLAVASASPAISSRDVQVAEAIEAAEAAEANVFRFHLPNGCSISTLAKCIYGLAKVGSSCANSIGSIFTHPTKAINCIIDSPELAKKVRKCKPCIPKSIRLVEAAA